MIKAGIYCTVASSVESCRGIYKEKACNYEDIS